MSRLLPDGMKVRWLGHATLDVFGPGDRRFLFDPFLGNNPAFPKALTDEVSRAGAYEALIVTHSHQDHFDDVLPLLERDPNLKVICQFEVGEWLMEKGIEEGRIVNLNPGGTTEFADVRVTMVNAIHSSSVPDEGRPFALGVPIGYVLRYPNGFTLYNTGDTAVTLDMQIVRDLYKPDLVILPIGDFYTMGAEQAAYALKLLQPRLALGIHWGTWNGKPPGTPEALEKELARYKLDTQLVHLKPGDTLT